jgi:hypothetical protein
MVSKFDEIAVRGETSSRNVPQRTLSEGWGATSRKLANFETIHYGAVLESMVAQAKQSSRAGVAARKSIYTRRTTAKNVMAKIKNAFAVPSFAPVLA